MAMINKDNLPKSIPSIIPVILQASRENKKFLKSTLKLGSKSFLKQVAKPTGSTFAKTTIKKIIISKITAKSAYKLVTGLFEFTAIADIAQFALECAGYQEVGKDVGYVGNVVAGAVGAVALGGGLTGAGIGIVVGTGLWFVGEVAGGFFDKMTE